MVSFHSILKGVYLFSVFISSSSALSLSPEERSEVTTINKRNSLLSKVSPILNSVTHLPSNQVPARGDLTTQTPEELVQLKRHAGLSASAYCRSVSIFKRWNCPSCQSSVPDGQIVFAFRSSIYDIHGFILNSDQHKTIYLVFRGTSSIENAVADINTLYTDYKSVKGAFVHQGFYDSFKSVNQKFLPVLLNHVKAHPSYQIVVTGHSLGGAIATLTAAYLFELDTVNFGPDRMKLYTYGAPRVGNEVFAKYLIITGLYISRSVHKADIVPKLPPVSAGFLHVGIESHITEDPDTVRVCTSKLESSLCSSPLTPFSLTDHTYYYGYRSGICLDVF